MGGSAHGGWLAGRGRALTTASTGSCRSSCPPFPGARLRPRGGQEGSVASTVEVAAMRRALALAADGPAHGPNPRVGCVLLDRSGAVVGEGLHRGAGTAHAEAAALAAAGDAARGGTAVVTLEPCAHTGRTGPCADVLVAAGVARVVVATLDPNPQAA